MPITFPTNPTVGQQFTYGGVTYSYTSQNVWLARAAGLAIASQAEAVAGTNNSVLMTPLRVAQYSPPAIPKIAFSANPSADQTGVVAETWTKVLFQTVIFNDSSLYNTSLSRWTPPAGKCQIIGSVGFSASTLLLGTPVLVGVAKNGGIGRAITGSALSTSFCSTSITIIDSCNGTDYYEINVYIYTNSTATVTASVWTYFMGTTL